MMFDALFFTVATAAINNSTVVTETTIMIPQWDSSPNDVVCFVGSGEGLEPDLMSTYGGGGTDCSAGNGCGVHIHSGMGCEDSTAQGGHWYDSATVSEDPWKQVGYKLTSASGTADFADCVQVGFDVKTDPSLLEGRAFVVHNNDGSRASCGLMTAAVEPTPAPTPSKSSKKSDKGDKKGKSDKKKGKSSKGSNRDVVATEAPIITLVPAPVATPTEAPIDPVVPVT